MPIIGEYSSPGDKLNAVNPHAWLTDTLIRLVEGWPQSRIDELMPWAYGKAEAP